VQKRIAAATAAAFAVAGLGACSPKPPTQLSSTASVTVNGSDTNFHVVKCGQLQWTRTIDIGGNLAGAKVIIDEGAQPASAQSVHIENVGGFTGMYSQGGGGDADMSMTGDKFNVSGTASGYKTDKPGEPATATFKIVVTC
jgi:ipoprotein LpqH